MKYNIIYGIELIAYLMLLILCSPVVKIVATIGLIIESISYMKVRNLI